MAAPTVADRLEHVARSIAAIEGYWAGKRFADYMANEALRAATERHLLIIAEAIKHIPQADKDSEPAVPWRDVIGLGNILRHGYDIIDEKRIWTIVESDLAVLKHAVAGIREHIDGAFEPFAQQAP